MLLAYLALAGRILLLGYEKIAVKKLGSNSQSDAATFLYFFSSTLFILPFLPLANWPVNAAFLKYLTVSSVIYTAAFLLYVRSISIGEVSLVSPLYNFNSLFLLILTWLFLNEPITPFKTAGILILLYGATFLNKRHNISASLKALFTDRACLMMIACSFLIAIGRTIDGFVMKNIDPIIYALGIYLEMSVFLFALIFFKKKIADARDIFRERRKITLIAGAVNAMTYLLLLYAITKIDVSVVEPSSMLGMIVTLILSHFLLHENIGDRLFGVIIMIAGAWALFS